MDASKDPSGYAPAPDVSTLFDFIAGRSRSSSSPCSPSDITGGETSPTSVENLRHLVVGAQQALALLRRRQSAPLAGRPPGAGSSIRVSHRAYSPGVSDGDEDQESLQGSGDEPDDANDKDGGTSPSSSPPPPPPPLKPANPSRSNNAIGDRCERCILQRKGCDGVKPVCGQCGRRKKDQNCVWPQGHPTRTQLTELRANNPPSPPPASGSAGSAVGPT